MLRTVKRSLRSRLTKLLLFSTQNRLRAKVSIYAPYLDIEKKQKANLLYLRGRILDFIPEYSKQAEEHLSKAIKLMPSKVEAWDALGHVYWKKNDLAAS